MKTTYTQNNFNYGEISPRAMGRDDPDKPLWKTGAAEIENFLGFQLGGIDFRPGTTYAAGVKTHSTRVRLIEFQYSTVQTYIIEAGNLYMRFFANSGVVLDGATAEEIVTIFPEDSLRALQYAQSYDVLYLTHGKYFPQKLSRLTATTFSIANVAFVRGPFRDDNITTTTITPSSATGATTLTASAAIFVPTHVGAFFRVNDGVVKITAFTSTTSVDGTVQAEPDGTAGDIGGTGDYDDWAEGAFSDYRGYPTACCFHEGRLYYAKDQTLFGSVVGEYDNFDKGLAADSDAVQFSISAQKAFSIYALSSEGASLICGTEGGTVSAFSNDTSLSITPTNPPVISSDTDYGIAPIMPRRVAGRLIFVQKNLFQVRERIYSLEEDKIDSENLNILADHILRDGDGVVEIARQQSPNDRLWAVLTDGTIAVLTRNAKQEVMGWCRITAGETAYGAGKFESVAIIPQDGADDQVWVVVQRKIGDSVKRFVEYFNPEIFDEEWDAVRLDSSLTLDNPMVISGATVANPVVVTTTDHHGFSNGDQIKIDNIEGMTELNRKIYLVANKTNHTFALTDTQGNGVDGTDYAAYKEGGEARKMVLEITSGLEHLEGETVLVQVDGGLPAGTQTYKVEGGGITLAHRAAVLHIGLPYNGKIKLLPLNDGLGPTKPRRIYLAGFRLYRSLGCKIGLSEDNLQSLYFGYPNDPKGFPPRLFTGNRRVSFDSGWDKEGNQQIVIVQDTPLPLSILAVVLRSETEEMS